MAPVIEESKTNNDGHIKVIDAVSQAADAADTTSRYSAFSSLEVRDVVSKSVRDWCDGDTNRFSEWL